MFDSVVLRRSKHGVPISAGQVAEALLYYQRVHLVLDQGTIAGLIKQIGLAQTQALMRRPELSAVYCEEQLVTKTDTVGQTQFHNYETITWAGHADDAAQLKSPYDRLPYFLRRIGLNHQESKRFGNFFFDRCPVRKLSGDFFIRGGVASAARRDLMDSEFVRRALTVVIGESAGMLPTDPFKFDILNADLGCVVFTDLNLELVNKRRLQNNPDAEILTVQLLLQKMLDARMDLVLAAHYGGDFVTSAIASGIIQVRYEDQLRRTRLNNDAKSQFLELVLPDTPALQEVIDCGEKSIADFLKLLDSAGRFKDWLKGVNPDESLVRTYHKDVASKDWIEKLPAKSVRYLITLSLEGTNPLLAMAAGLTDNFLVEKMLKGWRPNHFVHTRLSPFLRSY